MNLSNKQIKNRILFFLFFIVLIISFQTNYFKAASVEFFEGHQIDSESLVLGGIVKAKNKDHSLIGRFFELGRFSVLGQHDNHIDEYWAMVAHQYDLYENNLTPTSNFNTYLSSFGLQVYFYTFVDDCLIFIGIAEAENRLYLSRLLTSTILAFLTVLFVYFVKQRFGLISSVTTIFLITISQWFVVFANDLYWMFFLIVFPFIFVVIFLQFKCFFTRRFFFLYFFVFSAILIKSLAGYEYISTILISIVTPLIFFAIMDNWHVRTFINRFLLVGFSGLLGFSTAFFTHMIKLSHILGDLSNGFNEIWTRVLVRTYGNPDIFEEIYRHSLESNILDVFLIYLSGKAFDLESLFGFFGRSITFSDLILALFSLTIVGLILTKIFKDLFRFRKLNLATSLMLWFSITAPMSWYILAKAHSAAHPHMNHVLWYIPFLLIGFVYSGFIFSLVIKLAQDLFNRFTNYLGCNRQLP